MDATDTDTHYAFQVSAMGARRNLTTLHLRGDRALNDLHRTICNALDRHDDCDVYSFYLPSSETGYKLDPYPKEYVSGIILEKS